MLAKPRWLLHLEGTAFSLLAIVLYWQHHFGGLLFAALFFAPDLSMLGYLAGVRAGATCYNTVHTFAGPILLTACSLHFASPKLLPIALIWFAHIGFDRMLGFGLKYPTFFKDTHLQHV